jgi:hypothetical protein
MNDEALFIRTLKDLQKSINSNDEYEVLRASGLIRQLFLDGDNSLVDRVNRTHRIKLEFEIAESKVPLNLVPKPTIWASFTEINPKIAPSGWTRKKLNRDKFFAYKVASIEEHEYSIRELIKFASNTMGGVHSGISKDDKQKNLEKLKGLYFFSNINTALLFIKIVGRNVLETLTPLRNKILGVERFENSKGLSIFITLILFPLPNKESYILDIGVEENRNRLSVFLNSNSELCFRFINSVGRQYLINAGSEGSAYYYGERTFLSFQVSFSETELYLCVEDRDWQHIEIYPIKSNEFSEEVFNVENSVLGSNLFGKAETNMEMIRLAMCSEIYTLNEQMKIKNDLTNNFNQKEIKVVSFEGNQSLHMKTHPNFAKKPD